MDCLSTCQTVDLHHDIAKQIRSYDVIQEIKWLQVVRSVLGGSESLFVRLSLDSKDSWANGIFQNSRHAIFEVRGDKLSLIAKHYELPKFRKSKVKDSEDVALKIMIWVAKSNETT